LLIVFFTLTAVILAAVGMWVIWWSRRHRPDDWPPEDL